MKPEIPAVLVQEHANLLAGVQAASQEAGVLGEAARELGAILVPHIRKEEQFVYPPLTLLPALAEGRLPDDPAAVLRLTKRLKAELPELLAEHSRIRTSLKHLRAAAVAANRPAFERYADELMRHSGVEEEILYLAALLVGELLLMRCGAAGHASAVRTSPPVSSKRG